MDQGKSPNQAKAEAKTLRSFDQQQIPEDQLLQIRGGDGEDPPTDDIGHEDTVNN